MTTQMTNEAYIAMCAGVCPGCRHPDIEGGPIEIEGVMAYQDVACTSCGATWTDFYALQGYSNYGKDPTDDQV